jgi:hypothetical protein
MLSKKLLFILILVSLPFVSFAEAPDWQTPNGFEQSMSVTCQVFINDIAEQDTSNLVGAFVGEECRGVNDYPFFDNGSGVYVGVMTIASNTIGEEISFKLYDASSDSIYPIEETLLFQNDGYGSFDNPQQFNVTTGGITPEEFPWDVNGDGVVDFYDVQEVINHWGETPE